MLLGGPWYFTEIYKQNPSIELGWFLFPADYEKFMRWLTPYQADITEKQGDIKI